MQTDLSPHVSRDVALAIGNKFSLAEKTLHGISQLPPRLSLWHLSQSYENHWLGDTSRRAHGVYYTSQELVTRVLDVTLPVCPASEIVDIACGGGNFLLGAAQKIYRTVRPNGFDQTLQCLSILAGVDIDDEAVRVAQSSLALFVLSHVPSAKEKLTELCAWAEARVQKADGLLWGEPKRGRIVVGNPPWGRKKFQFSPEHKRKLKQFHAAHGVWDPAAFFLEHALQLCPQGAVGLVLPDTILLKNYKHLRKHLLKKNRLIHLAHVGQAFGAANIDAAILTVHCEPPEGHHQVDLATAGATSNRKILQTTFLQDPLLRFNVFASEEDHDLLQTLRALPRLADFIDFHEGVHSGNVRAKLFTKQQSQRRLLVGGNQVQAFAVSWSDDYLQDIAIDKAAGEYANLGQPTWHAAEKVLVRRTGDSLTAACDHDGLTVSNNLFLGLSKSSDPDLLCVVTALLNSSLLRWFYRTSQPRVGKIFAEVKIVHLRDFPVPPRALTDQAIKKQLRNLAHHWYELDPTTRQAELDQLVESLVPLSPGDRKRIRIAS